MTALFYLFSFMNFCQDLKCFLCSYEFISFYSCFHFFDLFWVSTNFSKYFPSFLFLVDFIPIKFFVEFRCHFLLFTNFFDFFQFFWEPSRAFKGPETWQNSVKSIKVDKDGISAKKLIISWVYWLFIEFTDFLSSLPTFYRVCRLFSFLSTFKLCSF